MAAAVSAVVTRGEQYDATALIRGAWKLVRTGLSLLTDPGAPGTLELFNLESDPYETRNIAGEYPDLVAELLDRTRAWRKLQPPDIALSPLTPPPGWQPPLLWRIPED